MPPRRVFSESAFASSLAKAVFENIDAVDAVIDKYSIGWKNQDFPKQLSPYFVLPYAR